MANAKSDSVPEGQGSSGNEKLAAEIVAQVESGPRDPIHWVPVVLILAICFGWSTFQLYHAQFQLNAKIARYIHLAFAMSLAFLAYPAFQAGIGAAAARTKRDIVRKGAILAGVAIAAGVIFFTDPVGGSLLFLVIFGFFFLIGIGLPQEVKRNLYMGLLLAIAAFLLWSNLDAILAGLATDAEGNPRAGLFDYWVPHAVLYAVAVGSLIEAPRRLATAAWQLFAGRAMPSPLVSRVLGLRINERARDVIPLQDYILALIGVGTALYLVLDFIKIATVSQGMIDGVHQLVFGVLLIMVLLEAARRSLGMPLVILSALFLIYDLYAGLALGRGTQVPWLDGFLGGVLPQLKDWLQPPPNILEAVIGTMYLQANAIFGTPIEVSTTYVFLFVLFGALLERAGAGKYFIDVAFAGLGSQRAGPAKAAIVASGLTGIVSGSSIANTVTTGTFTIPLMIKVGLPPYKAGAVEVAASTNG
ncbi:MAG: TRAP transporter large permease subunit [Bauldia litoralis]